MQLSILFLWEEDIPQPMIPLVESLQPLSPLQQWFVEEFLVSVVSSVVLVV